MDMALRRMRLGITPQIPSSDYLQALLVPESCRNARIPGLADACIPLHRKYTITVVCNVLGAANITWWPLTLCDTATPNSTLYVNNNATFDGFTTAGLTGSLAVVPSQSTTVGTVAQYRLVSACMHVVPQTSLLNQAGTIHSALLKVITPVPVPAGSAILPTSSFTLIPNFQNSPYYREASVSAMQGTRSIWVPNDPCLLEFADINTNISSNNPGESSNAMVSTIVGAGSGAVFRVDFYQNFEVTSAPGSILMGTESIASENVVAPTVWRRVLTSHKDDVVRTGQSISTIYQTINDMQVQPVREKNTISTLPQTGLPKLRYGKGFSAGLQGGD